MARYIDAEEAYALMEERGWYENGDRDIAEGVLDQMPTADVAPVVRCKDCVYFFPYSSGDGSGWCGRMDTTMDGINFCYHGAKMDGGRTDG